MTGQKEVKGGGGEETLKPARLARGKVRHRQPQGKRGRTTGYSMVGTRWMGLDDGQGVGTEAGEMGILAGWGKAFARGFRQKAPKRFRQAVDKMGKKAWKGLERRGFRISKAVDKPVCRMLRKSC